jgi:hypothetical protein
MIKEFEYFGSSQIQNPKLAHNQGPTQVEVDEINY